MDTSKAYLATTPLSEQLRQALSRELLRLAAQEEDIAAREAEHVHYWEAMPGSIVSHRQAAAALRAAAEELLPRTAHREASR